MFAFMADEVIECLYEGKRGYTASIYHKVNDRCNELAKSLGRGWTPRRAGRALWAASRISAGGGTDLTLDNHVEGEDPALKDNAKQAKTPNSRPKKRRNTSQSK